MFDNCGGCEGEAVEDLAQLLADGTMEVYEGYNPNNMSTDAHHFHETWPMAFNARIQQFLTEGVIQEAHILVTRASQRRNKDKLEIETRFVQATKQSIHIFSAMEITQYVRGLKPPIYKKMLEIIRRVSSNVRTMLNDIRQIVIAMECSQRSLMKNVQP